MDKPYFNLANFSLIIIAASPDKADGSNPKKEIKSSKLSGSRAILIRSSKPSGNNPSEVVPGEVSPILDFKSSIALTRALFGSKFVSTFSIINLDNDKESKYQLVGEVEADIEQKKISVTSPIARALIGKKKGDYIEVSTPKGITSYEIKSVRFK